MAAAKRVVASSSRNAKFYIKGLPEMAALFFSFLGNQMKRVVHIGHGKAATTTLQRHVFPQIAKSRQVAYLDPDDIAKLIANPADLPARNECYLASSEVLVGPPAHWQKNLEINRRVFGPDTTILLILRRPSGYLRSVFQQISHHSGLLLTPTEYFNCVSNCISSLFDPKLFDQRHLVKLYTGRFKEVIVQKFETVADLEFVRVAYDLSDPEIKAAQKNMALETSNLSFSQTAVDLSMRLKWAFGTPEFNLETGTIKRTLRYKFWRAAMQGVFDKLYPYKKYRLDWETVQSVDIGQLDAAYAEIPNFQYYQNGVLQPAG